MTWISHPKFTQFWLTLDHSAHLLPDVHPSHPGHALTAHADATVSAPALAEQMEVLSATDSDADGGSGVGAGAGAAAASGSSGVDVKPLSGVYAWWTLREFLTARLLRLNFQAGSPLLGAILCIDFAYITFNLLLTLVDGVDGLERRLRDDSRAAFTVVLIVMSSALSVLLLGKAAHAFTVQQRHIELLDRVQLSARKTLAMLGGEDDATGDAADASRSFLAASEEMKALIENHDHPPKLWGLAIRPTLFRVMASYFVTALVAILLQVAGVGG